MVARKVKRLEDEGRRAQKRERPALVLRVVRYHCEKLIMIGEYVMMVPWIQHCSWSGGGGLESTGA